MNPPKIPRLVPDHSFPPYSYVPGQFPHPISDPGGHSYGKHPEPAEAVAPDDWQNCRPYLWGIDLFNHGFYWEAHEVWESLWHATGRKGTQADFFKALIKLAAAGVKAREGIAEGVRGHAERARELFASVKEAMDKESGARYYGLELDELIRFAGAIKWTGTFMNDAFLWPEKTMP